MNASQRPTRLRVGDWVYVRSAEEIAATLDDQGRFDGLPFMPEMLRHCGSRLRVAKTAHKTCDTIEGSGGRRMRDAVHLDVARCDGSDHGGCEAGCTLFWKTAWLSLTPPAGSPDGPLGSEHPIRTRLLCFASRSAVDASETVYSCQATELLRATEPLSPSDLGQYVEDVRGGNHSVGNMLRLLAFTAYRRLVDTGVAYRLLLRVYAAFQRLRGGAPFPIAIGRISEGQSTPTSRLDLRPGERIRVKPIEEIEATITRQGFNRGMRFDVEMVKYCGKEYRVSGRVNRIINEKSGRMMTMANPCVLLEDVYCRAECTPGRVGCPRAVNTYWREIWLKRIDE